MKHAVGSLLAAVAALCLALACSSSSPGAAGRTSVGGGADSIWLAAQAAILDLGGRIVQSNRTVGSIVGRFDLEGRPVRLDVQVLRSPGADTAVDRPTDVSAQASLAAAGTPPPELQEELRQLVDRYLELVESRTRSRR